jgi:hypothetical protein
VLLGEWGWRLRDFQIDLDALARDVRQLQPFSTRGALRLVYRTYAAKFGKDRWGDKTPSYLYRMPLVARLLPEARFIHIIRDGRDVWQSTRSVWFGPDTVEDAAAYWRDVIATARRDAPHVPHYLEIRYEQLLTAPERVLRELCAYLELEWDSAMLRAHERAPDRIAEVVSDYHVDGRLLATAADRHRIHALTASPPDPSRVGVWRAELSEDEVMTFETIAGDTLRELGY